MYVTNRSCLPSDLFEGSRHGPAKISIIFSDTEPGGGPALHRHTYDETWVVLEGPVQVWIGSETGEAESGDIVVSPANTAHRFQNVGEAPARLVCIHASPRVITEWLPES